MPYRQEGGRDSRGIPEFECIPEEEQQAYLNAIEPFGGEMLRRKSLRLSQTKIKSSTLPAYPGLSQQGIRHGNHAANWDLPMSA